jgi:hypothetical protein
MLFHPSNSASLNKWVICDKRAYQKIEEGISKLRMKDEKALGYWKDHAFNENQKPTEPPDS